MMLDILQIRSELHPNGILKRMHKVELFCNKCSVYRIYWHLPGCQIHRMNSFIKFACALCKNESIRFLPQHFTWHDVNNILPEEVVI